MGLKCWDVLWHSASVIFNQPPSTAIIIVTIIGCFWVYAIDYLSVHSVIRERFYSAIGKMAAIEMNDESREEYKTLHLKTRWQPEEFKTGGGTATILEISIVPVDEIPYG